MSTNVRPTAEPALPEGLTFHPSYLGDAEMYQHAKPRFVAHLHTSGWDSETLMVVAKHKQWREEQEKSKSAAVVPWDHAAYAQLIKDGVEQQEAVHIARAIAAAIRAVKGKT